ncbi:MAG: rod shape-determining protein RodA [Thermodesulfobacteriota bacterium]|nr:MAG: rod shape-determining protein RodA [Thermodesulfobacteriota bacterium]
MHDRRFLEHFDWWLFLSVFLLMAIGFVNLNSGSAAAGYPFQWKQLQWYIAGTVLMLSLAVFFDYRLLTVYSVHIYLVMVFMLILVVFIGKAAGGSRRWLSLGFMNIQPSELAKLATVVVLSSYFYHDDRPQYSLKDLWRPALLMLVPVFLIYQQPDLGTALFLVLIFASLVYMARLHWKSFLLLLASPLAAFPFVWEFLKPYQRDRIIDFIFPGRDPLGAGYHILQSKIAIGSGQILGKGYMKGSQAHLNFLPEVHTDFAFAVWAEEWGWIGAVILLGVFFLMLYRGFLIASQSNERFGAFLAFGITAMLFWQMAINVGMVMGLMPVVGIPLPLVSYGGSSVFITLIGTGLLLNIRSRRFMFQKGTGTR